MVASKDDHIDSKFLSLKKKVFNKEQVCSNKDASKWRVKDFLYLFLKFIAHRSVSIFH